ncbi:para-aminobenzoate synthase, (PABA) [Elasticomyces elasticus]|nr:para-aminobenzoate synthase, (PABA) [Elasticomyces elasticus]
MPMSRPRILFLDAYDSFTNNIIALVEREIHAVVTVIKIDDERFNSSTDSVFHRFLQGYDAVIAGPGPGHPAVPEDVGLIHHLWHLPREYLLPVLGICLGFQSLALAYGATVKRLREPRHGLVTRVSHWGSSLFRNVGETNATQYHSLRVELDAHAQACQYDDVDRWPVVGACQFLEPLALDLTDVDNGPVLMAVRHITKPFWGVQYHPESICTNHEGRKIISNWWRDACAWKVANEQPYDNNNCPTVISVTQQNHLTAMSEEPGPIRDFSPFPQSSPASTLEILSLASSINDEFDLGTFTPADLDTSEVPKCHVVTSDGNADVPQPNTVPSSSRCAHWLELNLSDGQIDIARIVEGLCTGSDTVLLESGIRKGQPINPETGRRSIIGCVDTSTMHVRYYSSTNVLHIKHVDGTSTQQLSSIYGVLQYLERFLEARKATTGLSDSPFWGGFVGFMSYEAGLETIHVPPSNPSTNHPDLWFAFVERSIIFDHVKKKAYVQSIRIDDYEWLHSTQSSIYMATHQSVMTGTNDSLPTPADKRPWLPPCISSSPIQEAYCDSVRTCQEHIRAGSSYELCLTEQTIIESSEAPWTLYKRLRKYNPAPFGSYIRFSSPDYGVCQKTPGVSIVSSSPERFLSWSRDGLCQFRPIKGTVKKSPGMTRAGAEAVLNSAKERAENLMIVDLIRHDLHGVVGADNVEVKKLMGVEEYETVYQLVSVIEGRLPSSRLSAALPLVDTASTSQLVDTCMDNETATQTSEVVSHYVSRVHGSILTGTLPAEGKHFLQTRPFSAKARSGEHKSGIDVLAASLPPGSMTGAPKKRSCELLQQIEGNQRGIYSGVIGYLDIGGGGDFSVVIRTAFRWDDEKAWHVGAGGAVTAKSTPEGEYEEMLAKRESTLKAFFG